MDLLARETYAALRSSEPPNSPGQSTAQYDGESHSSPLIAELSALAIGDDTSTPPGAATQDPTDFSPAQASSPPPPSSSSSSSSPIREHDEYHDHNSPSDGHNEVSSAEEYYATQPVTPIPSSPSLFHQDNHPVFELASPSSHASDTRGLFTSSSSDVTSTSSGDPVLDGFLRSIYEQETAGGADFLCAQSGVYDKVFRSFFARECECNCNQLTLLISPLL